MFIWNIKNKTSLFRKELGGFVVFNRYMWSMYVVRVILYSRLKIYTYIFKEYTANLQGDIDDDDDFSK